MRILHAVSRLEPERGGPPVVAIQLARAQIALGHEAALLARGSLAQMDPLGEASALVHHRPGRAPSRWTEVVGGYDFVHLHEVWPPLLVLAALAARSAGVPYAVAPHGCLDPWPLAQKPLKKRAALRLGYRAVVDRAAFVHALTPTEADHVRALGIRAPIAVIPNGVSPAERAAAPPPGTFHGLHPELGGRPYALFLGRLHPKKGLDLLAEAFTRFAREDPQTLLVIVGPDEGARAGVEQQIRAAGLTDRVFLMGPRYAEEKLAAMVDAMCFVLPSRQEGFSMAILEALSLGVPVVASPECRFPEIESSGAGRVVERTPSAVAAVLAELAGDPAARRSMGERGRRLVAERFTWARSATLAVEAMERAVTAGRAA